ncbi:GtrA family protein [Lacticaseibacillus camelliae]|uniref:GtrA family protein n=1 Tax=Lacticaseibacillus camelliae TaxID=381742 RepID=UPI0006D16096|nr:GtrA family protein [Lacticaseibacillus camelliae]
MKHFVLQGQAWLKKRRLWDVVTYIFFGGLTTVVNIVTFAVAIHAGMHWWIANFIAWVLSVAFAFVTNKLGVFNSHTASVRELIWEATKFVFARVVSLGIDYGFMALFITWLKLGEGLAKVLTQFAIVVANYAFSKFIIFKNKPAAKA